MPPELPSTRTDDSHLRVACNELESRIRSGEQVRSEDYFAKFPELVEDPDSAVDLLYTEFVARQETGETPRYEEWYERFPQWKDQLRRQFQLHELLGETVDTASITAGDRSNTIAVGLLPHRVGHYEVLKVIGRGGNAVVYQARDIRLGRIVAVKMILAGFHANSDELLRFQVEAETVAQLSHPNIVQVHEVGEADGCPFLALEYMPGGSLADAANRPQSLRQAVDVVRTLALAVHYAHQQGIVHRDLKPANILLADDGTPRITDFGLAKHLGAQTARTRTGSILGTPGYMAPEQAAGESNRVGTPADVYSLGAILYQLLTNQAPFGDDCSMDTLMKVVNDEPPPPRRQRPDIPIDLESICLKCLQKEPSKRYASAFDLAEDLRRFIEGRPIRARRTTAWEKMGKWIRRRPAAAALTVVSVSAVVIGMAGSLWYNWRLDRALNRVEHLQVETARQNNELELTLNDVGRLQQETEAQNERLTAQVDTLRRGAYASQLAQVQSLAYREPTTALSLLAGVETCPPDLRDFTWGYWRRNCNRARYRLIGHTNSINSVCYSPDGNYLATASNDGTARLWDLSNGKELLVYSGHASEVLAVTFFKNATPIELRLATAGEDGAIIIWDLQSAEPLKKLTGHPGPVRSLAVSSDGRSLASGGDDHIIRLWDLTQDGEPALLEGHSEPVLGLAFSPDNKQIASGSSDRTVRLWDVASRRLTATLSGSRPKLTYCVKFSPDGKKLVAGRNSSEGIAVWDLARKDDEPKIWNTHYVINSSLAFFPGGSRLLSGSSDGVLRVWSFSKGKEEVLFRQDPIQSVAVSPDFSSFASVGASPIAWVWRMSRESTVSPLESALEESQEAYYADDGQSLLLVTGPSKRSIVCWDLKEQRPSDPLLIDPRGLLAVSPDCKTVAYRWERGVKLIDARSGTVQSEHASLDPRGKSPVTAAAFSHDGCYTVGILAANAVVLKNGTEVVHRFTHKLKSPFKVVWSVDDQFLAIGGGDGTIKIWNTAEWSEFATLTGHSDDVACGTCQ